MKRNIIRVSLSFATLNDLQLNNAALVVAMCLTGNALFPNPPLTIAELTALQTDHDKKITEAERGGHLERVALQEARAALIVALRRIAAYVQCMGLDSEVDVLSSGFDIVRNRKSPTPATLDAPALIGLDNSVSTQLTVRLRAVDYARGYEVQYCQGTNPWVDAGFFHSTRNIVLSELTSGTVYSVRIRAIGGLNRYSEWSASLSLMVT